MTGDEHHAEADRLLAEEEKALHRYDMHDKGYRARQLDYEKPYRDRLRALALIHATLAASVPNPALVPGQPSEARGR